MKEIFFNSLPILIIFIICVLGLSVGILFKGKCLVRTCSGGKSNGLGEKESCENCPRRSKKAKEEECQID
jgi:hypothetical protein